VRVVARKIHEERPGVRRLDHAARLFGHLHGAAPDRRWVIRRAGRQHRLERIRGFRCDVKFSDPRRPVASLREQHRQALHRVEGLEVMIVVLEAVHPVPVIVLAAQDHRSGRTAARGRAERRREARAVRRQRIQVRRPDDGVAVTSQGLPPVIVGDNHHDVRPLVGAGGSAVQNATEQQGGENERSKGASAHREMRHPDTAIVKSSLRNSGIQPLRLEPAEARATCAGERGVRSAKRQKMTCFGQPMRRAASRFPLISPRENNPRPRRFLERLRRRRG
jgi:hypothetical protein